MGRLTTQLTKLRATTSLLDRLSEYRWIHLVLRWLRVYPLTSTILHVVPMRRHLRPEGLVYRISSLDQLGLQAEIFYQEVYAGALEGKEPPETVIDLGSNAGWFDVWLARRGGSRATRSLLVEADPRLVAESKWHVAANRLQGCRVIHGAAGVSAAVSEVTFYISASASQSALTDADDKSGLPAKGPSRKIVVPAVDVGKEWTRRFGQAAVDLMKIDIEGAEIAFLQRESGFVSQRVRRIVVEWDKWASTAATLERQLADLGFTRTRVIKEGVRTGVAVFDHR